jgi:hypothetical protein
MVIAALISFGILLLAWVLAPEPREPAGLTITRTDADPEPLPLPA